MNKLYGNRANIEPYSNPAASGFDPIDHANAHIITHSIRIEVYKGNKYQGKKIFSQDRIIIGSSLESDLVLSDNEIADKHAYITFIDDQPVILDQTQKAGMLIKGGLCGISIIDSTEQVGLGPYTLKISHLKEAVDKRSGGDNANAPNINKEIRVSSDIDLPFISETRQAGSPEQDIVTTETSNKKEKPEVDLFSLFEGSPAEDHELFDLVFEGDIKKGCEINKVKTNLSKIFKSDESRIENFFTKKKIILKSALKKEAAKKYKKVFERSGAVCRLAAHKSIENNEHPVKKEEPENTTSTISEQYSGEIRNIEVKKEAYREQTDNLDTPVHHPSEENSAEIQALPSRRTPMPKEEDSKQFPVKDKTVWKFYGVDVDEEDDEDEEDLPANFYLKDKLNDLNAIQSRNNSLDGKYLEILKLDGHQVIDIRHLEEKDRFYISG